MINTFSIKRSTMVVLASRVAISMTGLLWLYEGDALKFSVAIGALALTVLPGLLVRDLVVRDATSVVSSMLLAAHVVVGMQGAQYETSYLYDKAMHVLGSGAIAALLMLAVYRYCNRHLIEVPMALIVTIVLGGTLSAGTLWELFEFAMDSTGLFYAQRGLQDTMLDLLADASGGLLFFATLFTANFLGIGRLSRTSQH